MTKTQETGPHSPPPNSPLRRRIREVFENAVAHSPPPNSPLRRPLRPSPPSVIPAKAGIHPRPSFPSFRHSRANGNPSWNPSVCLCARHPSCHVRMDSRFRGNDKRCAGMTKTQETGPHSPPSKQPPQSSPPSWPGFAGGQAGAMRGTGMSPLLFLRHGPALGPCGGAMRAAIAGAAMRGTGMSPLRFLHHGPALRRGADRGLSDFHVRFWGLHFLRREIIIKTLL